MDPEVLNWQCVMHGKALRGDMMRHGYETPQMYIAELKKEKPKEVSEICIQEWIGGDVHHRYMEFSMRNGQC